MNKIAQASFRPIVVAAALAGNLKCSALVEIPLDPTGIIESVAEFFFPPCPHRVSAKFKSYQSTTIFETPSGAQKRSYKYEVLYDFVAGKLTPWLQKTYIGPDNVIHVYKEYTVPKRDQNGKEIWGEGDPQGNFRLTTSLDESPNVSPRPVLLQGKGLQSVTAC